MGMYTEIFFRAELVRDVPEDVVAILKCMQEFWDPEPEGLPDHPLFECSRWKYLGCSDSSYFPIAKSSMEQDSYSGQWRVMILSNLKNYSGEIGKFFDWIDPYVDGPEGSFLGYSLYEEDDVPTLFQKQTQKDYFTWDKEMYNMWRAKAGLPEIKY